MAVSSSFTLEQCVNEGAISLYTATIKDEDGNVIPGTSLDTLTLTLYTLEAQTIINSRDSQNILGVNGGAVDGLGILTMDLNELDNAIINNALDVEWREMLFKWTYATSTRTGRHFKAYPVRNLSKVP